MAQISYKSDRQKEFGKCLDTLCGSRSRWNVWSDWLRLSAYAISNCFDGVHREQREQEYLRIAKGYTQAEMETMSKLLAIVVSALDENPEQDFLGELYMAFGFGDGNKGQFFTPYHIAHFMSEVVDTQLEDDINKKGWASVSDPCCGAGAMLVAFANVCKGHGINYQQSVLFAAQDIDYNVALMAYIQLSLLGCAGYVVVGNSLAEPLTGCPLFAPMGRETFVTPMYCHDVWELRRSCYIYKDLIDKAFGEIEEQSEPEYETEDAIVEETKVETEEFVPIQLSLFEM